MADFGGQLGLWSGVSFLTCFEFLFLLIETLYMVGCHQRQKWLRKKHDKMMSLDLL